LSVKFAQWWRVYDALPQEIRDEWVPPKYKFWKFYRIKPIGAAIEALRSLKRNVK